MNREFREVEAQGGTFDNETIRLTKDSVEVQINTISGMEGEIWIFYCASLQVSGYGDSYEEARRSFKHNMNVFLEDLLDMRPAERLKELRDLGWKQLKFRKKQFSKAYVDDEGVLQNLTNGKVEGMKTFA